METRNEFTPATSARCSQTIAQIVEFTSAGEILVETNDDTMATVLCDFLWTSHHPAIELGIGDRVVVLLPANLDEKGCVLGKIGPYRQPDFRKVTIEASEHLELKCGDGSIAIRKDGRVLTRGLDVATVARRSNRIRGGSVQIN